MPPTRAPLAFHDIAIDFAGRRLLRGGIEQPLEPKAFAVLALLAGSPGSVFTRDEILDAVWGHRHVTPGVLNRVMTLLRHALGEDAHAPLCLHTVHGVGYRFDLPGTGTATSPAMPTPDQESESVAARPPMRRASDRRRDLPRIALWLLPLLAALAFSGWKLWTRTPDAHETAKAATPASPATASHSIAVLPFVNASRDADQQFFSDGLSDNLIDALSRFEGLKVIGRMSSFRFRDGKEGDKAIGDRLGVAYLVAGSVQRADDMVRINASLTRVADGSTLWAEHYDRPFKDLFALQDELAQAIATALHAKLLSAEDGARQGERPPSGNIAAYDAYLRGMQAFYRDDTPGIIEYQQLATRLDPGYASAWAQLGIAWTFLGETEGWGTPLANRDYARARTAIDTALRLSPDLGVAHGALGNLLFTDGIDWNGALAELRRATLLDPNNGQSQGGLSRVLAATGKLREAIEHRDRYLSIEPLFAANYYHHAQLMLAAGRLDQAEQDLRIVSELEPAPHPSRKLAWIAIVRGDAHAALEVAKAQPAASRGIDIALAAQIGPDRAFADAAVARMLADQAVSRANPYLVAQVFALRGDAGRTVEWLERAWAIRDTSLHLLLYDPLILRLRKDPGLAAFCAKVGLPPPDASEALGMDQIRALLAAKH